MASATRTVPILAMLFLLGVAPGSAQNRGDCRGQQPTDWSIRVAAVDEPGERMVVAGTVYDSDGKRALAGHTVFVFQTDAEGYYSVGGMDESDARLCGLMLTDAAGRYRFETIKPAHYATGGPHGAHPLPCLGSRHPAPERDTQLRGRSEARRTRSRRLGQPEVVDDPPDHPRR